MTKLRALSAELSRIELKSPRYPEPGPLRKLPMARRSTPLLTLPFTSKASLAPGPASSMPEAAGSAAGGSPEAFKSARWKPGRALAAAVAAVAALGPFFAAGALSGLPGAGLAAGVLAGGGAADGAG